MKKNKIIKELGEIIENDLEKDYQCDFSDVTISSEIYDKIKNAAAEIDRQYIERKRRVRLKRLVQTVACFIAVCSVITFTMPQAATAMKALLFDVSVDEEAGGMALEPQKDFAVMSQWDEYYYPQYLPDGFELEIADDEYVSKKMIFGSKDSDIIIDMQQDDLNANVSHDIDTASVERIRINGWDGYIFIDEEYCYVDLILYTDINLTTILMRESTDEDIVLDIAENLKLIKNE